MAEYIKPYNEDPFVGNVRVKNNLKSSNNCNYTKRSFTSS